MIQEVGVEYLLWYWTDWRSRSRLLHTGATHNTKLTHFWTGCFICSCYYLSCRRSYMFFMMLPLSIKIVPATGTLKATQKICSLIASDSSMTWPVNPYKILKVGTTYAWCPPHAKFVWFQLYTVQTDSVKMITIVTLVPENLRKAAVIALPRSSCLRW